MVWSQYVDFFHWTKMTCITGWMVALAIFDHLRENGMLCCFRFQIYLDRPVLFLYLSCLNEIIYICRSLNYSLNIYTEQCSIYLSMYNIYKLIYLFIYLSIYLCIYLFAYLSIWFINIYTLLWYLHTFVPVSWFYNVNQSLSIYVSIYIYSSI